MYPRARAICTIGLVILAAGVEATVAVAAPKPWQRWEVTLALRITGTNGKPSTVRVALPRDSATRKISDLTTSARGWNTDVVLDSDDPHIVFSGKAKNARRFATTFQVASQAAHGMVGQVRPVDAPAAALVPYLNPSPLFQSRSILVREFLELYVAPSLAGGQQDLLRAIYDATRGQIEYRRDGKSLTLDVIRRRQGKRIGIERAFVTFLRCARIPARLVEGIDLRSSTQRKRRFWTEVWAGDRWIAVSASQGWIGKLPASYLALARDGRRIVTIDGPGKGTYVVQVRRLKEAP